MKRTKTRALLAGCGCTVVGLLVWRACAPEPDPGLPLAAAGQREVVEVPEPPSPWKRAPELTDEEADVDPNALLPAKLQLVEFANDDADFIAAPEPLPALADDPKRPPTREELLLFIARNAVLRKDRAEANKFYDQLVAASPANAEYRAEYAESLLTAGKKDEAAKQFEAALPHAAGKTPVEMRLAEGLGAAGQWSKAADLMERVGTREPKNAAVQKLRTKAWEKSGKPRPVVAQPAPTTVLPVAPVAPPPDSMKAPPPTPAPTNVTQNQKTPQPAPPKANADPTEQPPRLAPPADPLAEFERAFAANPLDLEARLGVARLKLRDNDAAAAAVLLAGATPEQAEDREYLLTLAWYHAAVGELGDAKCILGELLEKQPHDYAAQLAYADAHFLSRDYLRALAEFGKIPPDQPECWDAGYGSVQCLLDLHRYDEACSLAESLAARRPHDPAPAALAAEALFLAGRGQDAIGRIRAFLATAPLNCAHPARLQLAKLLLRCGRKADARSEFEILERSPLAKHPIVVWGLWAVRYDPHGEYSDPHPDLPADSIDFALTVSEFLMQLERRDDAVQLLEQCRAFHPDDPAVLNRLGDALAAGRRRPEKFAALDAYMRALTLSERNSRALLEYARTARSARMYEETCTACDRLFEIDPNHVAARLEKARALFAAGRVRQADAQYAAAAGAPAEEQLRCELGRLCEAMPADACKKLLPALSAKPQDVRRVVAEIAEREPDLRANLERLGADFDALANVRTATALEREVKDRSLWAPIAAIDAGTSALAVDPANTEVTFELARNYSKLGSTRMAEQYYREVLAADSGRREAAVAADRLDLEHGSQFRLATTASSQRGRDGRADIDRIALVPTVRHSLGDEDEFVLLGNGYVRYRPQDERSLYGDIVNVHGQYKPFDLLLVHASLNFEMYQNRLDNRVTYDVGGRWRGTDCWQLRASAFGANVVENGEALRQDIHRNGVAVGGDWFASRWVEYGGTYKWSSYSDSNSASELNLYYWRRLALWPSELKFIANLDYLDYERETVFPLGVGGPLFGAAHPYFAPQGYTLASAHLEWTHSLVGECYKEANQAWVGARAGAGVDSDGEGFLFGKLAFHRDLCYWLSFHGELSTTQSAVYRDLSAYAYFTARLRGLHKTCWLSCGDDLL